MSSPGEGPGGHGSGSTAGEEAQQSIFERLIGMLVGGEDEERRKKRQLKLIAKELKKSKYKFYKPRASQVQPALAKFFHEMYKTVGPAQTLLSNAESSTALRGIAIDSFLSESQRAKRAEFEPENIREQAKVKDTNELKEYLKDSMVEFFGSFDTKTVKEINETYNNLRKLVNFVRFDFYFLLRKFDSSFPEGDFTYKPSFESLQAEYVSDDLKDFLEIAYPLDKQANWDNVFDVLRSYKGVETIARAEWKKLVGQVEDVLKSGVLTMIIQHADEDPSYQASSRTVNERIVEPYLESLKTNAEGTVQKMLQERREKKADDLKEKIFGTTAIARAKFYTETANLVFTKRKLSGYTYTEPFNYLKAFLIDYIKKDAREVVRDILIVRGQWSDNVTSQRLSEAFHEVFTIADKVVKFDDSLAEEGERGQKIKRAMGRIKDRDSSTTKLLKQTLDEVNKEARSMIMDSAQSLISLAKDLKMLIDDYDESNSEVILNWKDLDTYIEDPLKDRMISIYRTSYYFVQLLQMYVKKQAKQSGEQSAGKQTVEGPGNGGAE